MSQALTIKIPIRNREGRVIQEKEVATYAGLLAKAHEEGLKSIATELFQVPDEGNHGVAIVVATVETEKGVFTGIGDAAPNNVNRRIVPHLIRMAETRAKARALRDAVNIGTVALEELGGDVDGEFDSVQRPPSNVEPLRVAPGHGRSNAHQPPPLRRRNEGPRPGPRGNEPSDSMTEAQRRLLFRILSEHGYEGDDAVGVLCQSAKVDSPGEINKVQASALINAWKEQGASRAS